MQEDVRVLGIDIDQLIPPDEQVAEPEDYELWPEHASAWAVFVACKNQWRLVIGAGGGVYWVGLEMTGVDVIRRGLCVGDDEWPEVLEQLLVLEGEAKKLRNQARE